MPRVENKTYVRNQKRVFNNKWKKVNFQKIKILFVWQDNFVSFSWPNRALGVAVRTFASLELNILRSLSYFETCYNFYIRNNRNIIFLVFSVFGIFQSRKKGVLSFRGPEGSIFCELNDEFHIKLIFFSDFCITYFFSKCGTLKFWRKPRRICWVLRQVLINDR